MAKQEVLTKAESDTVEDTRSISERANPAANVPAIITAGKTLHIPGIGTITVAKSVTRPTFPQRDEVPFYIRIDGAIRLGQDLNAKAIAKGRGKVSDMEVAHVVDVFDLETQSDYTLIVNTVLGETLNEAYPKETYIGKYFAVKRSRKVNPDTGKARRYADYEIKELIVTPDEVEGD